LWWPPGKKGNPTMKLLLDTQRAQLLAKGKANNLRRNNGLDEIDFPPVVKLFTPDRGATWLLTEVNPDEPDIAFGLCYLGMGCPELGYVSLAEITALRGKLGLSVERDLHFVTDRLFSDYAAEASQKEGAGGLCRRSGSAGQTAIVAQVIAEVALLKGLQRGVGELHASPSRFAHGFPRSGQSIGQDLGCVCHQPAGGFEVRYSSPVFGLRDLHPDKTIRCRNTDNVETRGHPVRVEKDVAVHGNPPHRCAAKVFHVV
jgi:hypothetical protein